MFDRNALCTTLQEISEIKLGGAEIYFSHHSRSTVSTAKLIVDTGDLKRTGHNRFSKKTLTYTIYFVKLKFAK